MKILKLNFLTHKFLATLLITMAIIFTVFTNTCFAATYDLSDYKNIVGNNRWCVLYSIDNDEIYLIMTGCDYLGYDWEYKWCGSNSNVSFYTFMGGITVYAFNEQTSKFDLLSAYEYQTFTCGKNLEFIACNKDIIQPTSTTTTSVVFQQTPVPLRVVIKPTLVETVKQALEEMIQKIVTNLQKIMTAGLVVLSIGLVILLIKSVISRAT